MSHDTSKKLRERYSKSLKISFAETNWASQICYAPLQPTSAEAAGNVSVSSLKQDFDPAALVGGRMHNNIINQNESN